MSGVDESKAQIGREETARFADIFQRITAEVHKYIVGQDHVVDGVLGALVCHGHALLEGVPGIGKTMLVRTLGQVLDLPFSRIQFTPDMLPADILGSNVLEETGDGKHEVVFQQGPIMTSLLLADEINRATPKTQSALLEAMQERQVTVGRETYPLPSPFIVLATQNPVEQEGTYPLPEAQLDRFLFKIKVGYPQEEDYHAIVERTTAGHEPEVAQVATVDDLKWMTATAMAVPVPAQIRTYCIRLVMATQPGSAYMTKEVERFVELGASPRGVQGLVLAGKVRALCAGRTAVSCADIREVALAVLRHRVMLNFEARAEGMGPDQVLTSVLNSVPESDA